MITQTGTSGNNYYHHGQLAMPE